MVKTITIKDEIYKKLTLQKGKDDSFSDLFERLLDDHISSIHTLKKLRDSIEFDKYEKKGVVTGISDKRSEEIRF
jgi:predicted CopG family antitoxin